MREWAKVSGVRSAPRSGFAGIAAATALLGSAGCTGLEQANAAGIAHEDVVSDLAGQLAAGSGLSYTATYRLAGGDTGTITQAQQPARTAYAYAGGRVIVTATGVVKCAGQDRKAVCTETDPASAESLTPARDVRLGGTALVTPAAVLDLLNTAALDQQITALHHDTTIAGRHATCLDLRDVDGVPAGAFGVCVTNEGALASFTATVEGTPVDVALTDYSDRADPGAFDIPPQARLVDKRTW